jgi:hypothetical protein
VERRAAFRIGRGSAQIVRHLLNEADRCGATQDAGCDAAAELGMSDLLIAVKVHQEAPGVVTIR